MSETAAPAAAAPAPVGGPASPAPPAPSPAASPAPATRPAPQQPVTAQPATRPTINVAEARAALRTPLAAAPAPAAPVEAPAATNSATTAAPAESQPRNPDGTYASPAAAPAPAPPAEPAGAEVPPGQVRVPIPDGHPLRDRGMTHVDVPSEHADYHRWAINNAIRRNQLDHIERESQTLRQQNHQLQARLEAYMGLAENVISDPAVAQQAAEIEEMYGAAAKQRYLHGVVAEAESRVDEIAEQQAQEYAQQQLSQQADQFISRAVETAQPRYPLWNQHKLSGVIQAYGALMHARGQNEPNLAEFIRFADADYMQLPQVQQQVRERMQKDQQQQNALVAAKERQRLANEEKQRLDAAVAARAQNPFARVPSAAAATGRTVPVLTNAAASALQARNDLFRPRRAAN
jgi:hypothetical protein